MTILTKVAAVALAAVGFSALTRAGDAPRFNIPFNYEVAGVTNTAGEYQVMSIMPSAIKLSHVGGNQIMALIQTKENKTLNAQGKPVLVFKKYGNQFFLSAVQTAPDTPVCYLPESKRQREYRANAEPPVTEVVVAAQ